MEAVEQLDVNIAMIGGPLPREIGTTFDLSRKLKDRFGDLDGRIHWLGRLKNEELPTYYNQARAFVISSRSEGTNRSMIEAMACGLPVIGTNVPELKYMLQHEETGYLCETDADSIAAAIETVLSKPTLMQTMGENARKFAVEHYSLEQLAQRGFDLLQEVATSNPVSSVTRRVAQYLTRRNA